MWWPVLNSDITTVSMSSCCTRISLRIHHNLTLSQALSECLL
nr:MAG TPA: hypothetical protein [Caudoviricetes sp.]